MHISDGTVERLLHANGVLNDSQIEELVQHTDGRPLQDIVIERNLISDRDLNAAYAEDIGVKFVDIDARNMSTDFLELIPEQVARQYNAIVIGKTDSGVEVAMDDPDDIQAVDFLKKQLGENLIIDLATTENIIRALDNYHGDVDKQLDQVIEAQKIEVKPEVEQQAAAVTDITEDSPTAQTINLLLEYAVKSGASDVHIEPREDGIQVRYRIDGVLKEVNRLPKNVQDAIVSRIKILANLKIDERRVPQDGRFKIVVSQHTYALRVSTLPITDGEKVVMRILDEGTHAASLENLGFWGHALNVTNKAIVQPHGMILVTGPTGSGKSTSLFSLLTILNKPSINISTVEDPVEYKIPGVNQTQVNPKAGMTFASGLRALLRQDPNVIMVGEVRDKETADLAVQAALTGHLVLSTLHTNNAATTLPRLLDMGIEPFLIASTIRAVIGQRLVRSLDQATREQYTPTDTEVGALMKTFNLPEGEGFKIIHELEKKAASQGIGGDAPLSTTETGIAKLWRPVANQNDAASTDGYKGRIGIYEAIDNSTALQQMIVGNATSEMIQKQAISEGMLTMQLDGLIKALRGQTTVEEVLRVTSS